MKGFTSTKTLAQHFENLVSNHKKLKGSREEDLEISCEVILNAMSNNSSSVLNPICEQITRSTKKSKRAPFIDVADWLHEKSTKAFDDFILDSINTFSKDGNAKRAMMGSCILIRTLALTAHVKTLIEPLVKIVSDFNSEQASLFEMEVYNTAVFVFTSSGIVNDGLKIIISRFSLWMNSKHPIAAVAAAQLVKHYDQFRDDQSIISITSVIRVDIPPSTDKNRNTFSQIVENPFNSPLKWVEFGLILGRFDNDKIKNEIALLSTEKGQFSSIITVALSAQDETIQSIARAIFRNGIHGKETSQFDPSSLSQILEQSDELTDIAITFLSEMAIANPKDCIPQLFPLLQSDKAVARKNSLELLTRVLSTPLDQGLRQMIASSILPLIGDDAISVRVDIPKLFVSVAPSFIVPPLIRLLSDPDERKRATASASMKLIMEKTDDPALLLKTILDCVLGSMSVPSSPADIQTGPSKETERSRERAFKLVENWANNAKGTMLLDPTPVLTRFWDDPKNEIIVSFVTKCSPLYDQNRLLASLLTQLRKDLKDPFERLAPLLILRSMPLEFFLARDTVASPLFDLLFVTDDQERAISRQRGEILARFAPSFVIPRLIEFGLFNKFCLYIICVQGQIHQTPLPYVCDEFEKVFQTIENDLFVPICDAFYLSDRKRCLKFAVDQNGTTRSLIELISSFRKFSTLDCEDFIKSGLLDKMLKIQFGENDEALALDALFTFTYQYRDGDLGSYWDNLFDIASHFSDSDKTECVMSALKLIGALSTNKATNTHLYSVYDRFTHIITRLIDNPNQQIRMLAEQLYAPIKQASGQTHSPHFEEVH